MTFDWTINVSTMIGAGSVLVAVVRYGIKLHHCLEIRLDDYGLRLDRIEKRQRATRARTLRMHAETAERLEDLRRNIDTDRKA